MNNSTEIETKTDLERPLTNSDQNLKKARKWYLTGNSLLFIGGTSYIIMVKNQNIFLNAMLVFIIFFSLFIAMISFQKARKYKLQQQTPKLPTTEKTDVLYLRSFDDDKITSQYEMQISFKQTEAKTYEEQMTEVLSDFGKVVAAKVPREELHNLGAFRLDLNSEKWQIEIECLISSAKIVFLRAGVTSGIINELELVLTRVEPERLVLLIPFGKEKYEAFQKKVKEIKNIQLPDYRRVKPCPGKLCGIIYFNSEWKPCFQLFDKRYEKSNEKEPLIPIMKIALKPIYEKFK